MPYRDPRCVYVTDNMGSADVVVCWLEQQGFPAKVMNRGTMGGLLGLTPFSTTGVSSDGVEVWVMSEADSESAQQALAQHGDFHRKAADSKSPRGPVNATCEDCGKTTTFAAEQHGTVQDCPHCGEYMDVLDEGEEFQWPADTTDDPT
jgi:membrane protease subunit (stomatin/prohibitin family)